MIKDILNSFGLQPNKYVATKLSSGLINNTWKISGEDNNYILQQVNKNVFKSPEDIAQNIKNLDIFLAEHHPNYLFISLLMTPNGEYLVINETGEVFRLMSYVKNSQTLDTVTTRHEAFEAARQFGKFTSNLSGFNTSKLRYTLPDFHNLTLRFEQFELAYKNACEEKMALAADAIKKAFNHKDIVQVYQSILKNQDIPSRVIHHDTKISNVLFDKNHCGLCVIDLDTVMPGYFFSDVGDMMRTYLSPANEEEKDFSKVIVREDFFQAIIEGYFSEMSKDLTATEKTLIVYSGKFMIYMQAIRFLTDFLNGDIYYSTSFPKHNLVRAQNQFTLLNRYLEAEESFSKIVRDFISKPIAKARA